jgi:hypothetical protein
VLLKKQGKGYIKHKGNEELRCRVIEKKQRYGVEYMVWNELREQDSTTIVKNRFNAGESSVLDLLMQISIFKLAVMTTSNDNGNGVGKTTVTCGVMIKVYHDDNKRSITVRTCKREETRKNLRLDW